MKIAKSRHLPALLALVCGGLLSGQPVLIDLHLKPEITSKTIARVDLKDPRLGQATPVLDEAKAALGWHSARFTGAVDGYVPDAKIGKDMLPVDDAVIYADPAPGSAAIGVFRMGDPVEIIDTGAWWHLRWGGGLPVYFVLSTPPPLPPVSGTALGAGGAAAGTAGALARPSSSSAGVTMAPAVDVQGEGYAGDGSSIVLPEKTEKPRPGMMSQSYEGVFRQSKRGLGLFAPKAPFYLEGGNGERIAWVETSDIVVPGSMKTFLNQQVILHGERALDPVSKEWIIHARNMRLK